MKRAISVALACLLLVGVAFGDKHGKGKGHNQQHSFNSGVIGSTPGLTIGGIMSGPAPWVVHNAKATLSPSGELELEVHGLLIASGPVAGTTGPVTKIEASLVCGGSGGTVVATTAAVDLSPEGDAELEAKLTLPTTPCFGPIILVRIAGLSAGTLPANPPFIAVTGFIPEPGEGYDHGDN